MASCATGLSAGFFYWIASGFGLRCLPAVCLTALFAFGTPLYSTASRSTDRQFAFSAPRSCAFRSWTACTVCVVPSRLSAGERQILSAAGPQWLAYNQAIYADWLPPYARISRVGGWNSFGTALLANLFSPARGRFIFSPSVALLVTGLWSVGVHYRGANNPATLVWNVRPLDVDQYPERVSDWSDPQFLRGMLCRTPEPGPATARMRSALRRPGSSNKCWTPSFRALYCRLPVDSALTSLSKYASQRLLSYLERHASVPDEPFSVNFPAAVLFADMQNFTLLAERLTREDPRLGVQKLAGYLDIYIGRLVDIITECGGDIVKFAGDACFAIWPVPEPETEDGIGATPCGGALGKAVRLAVHCGLEIQKQLHNYKVDDDVTLALRVGVSAGSLHELHLGGYLDRWEQLFAGTAMGQAGNAGTKARPGQVILDSRAVRALEVAGLGYRMPEAQAAERMAELKRDAEPRRDEGASGVFCYRPPDPAELPGSLKRSPIPANAREAFNVYIPRAVLVGDATGMRAELRPVTVLFCKVKGVDFSADTPAAVIQIIMLVMQECVYRYEGSLNRFGVDEKGAILLAAFGLPPLVHADDPIRGIRAALDIRRALKAVGYDSSIGIATGRAFCGTVGNETRCEYTMHGTNVNLSARLMVNAESILCDENTQIAAASEFEFEEMPPLNVKGREDAVQTYRPLT